MFARAVPSLALNFLCCVEVQRLRSNSRRQKLLPYFTNLIDILVASGVRPKSAAIAPTVLP